MFGEYAQIASFLSQPRDGYGQANAYQNEPLPAYLRPPYNPPHPWGHKKESSHLKEDFIMIAEFSELEGPKPVLTIPKNGGEDFDQNAFSVRILAVDHQTPSDGFSISEDTQVVLSEIETGVFAFVHHLVLYDNTARGFVRPFCMAYITTEQRKLMGFYKEISSQFKKVARYLKYGNLMLFVSDLERHLKDLDHTKEFLLNQVSKSRLKDSEVKMEICQESRKNAENELYRGLQTIRQSTTEIRDLLTTLKPLLNDKRLEVRFRYLEEQAFQRGSASSHDKLSLQEDWFNDPNNLEKLNFRYGSFNEPSMSPLSLFQPKDHKPLLVETKKAKRFNTPLRGLHELCSWGAKEGLRKLRVVHEYFKRDMVIMEIERNESKLLRPSSTGIFHGQCITGNFLSGIHIRHKPEDDENFLSNFSELPWECAGSLDSLDSFKSAGSFSSYQYRNASPSSFQTFESYNGCFYQSAPSSPKQSFLATEISPDTPTQSDSLLDRNSETCDSFEKDTISPRSWDKTPECVTEKGSHDCDVSEATVCNPGSAGKESFLSNCQCRSECRCSPDAKPKFLIQRSDSADFSDDEEPVIVFTEKIERPISVSSNEFQAEEDLGYDYLEADVDCVENCDSVLTWGQNQSVDECTSTLDCLSDHVEKSKSSSSCATSPSENTSLHSDGQADVFEEDSNMQPVNNSKAKLIRQSTVDSSSSYMEESELNGVKKTEDEDAKNEQLIQNKGHTGVIASSPITKHIEQNSPPTTLSLELNNAARTESNSKPKETVRSKQPCLSAQSSYSSVRSHQSSSKLTNSSLNASFTSTHTAEDDLYDRSRTISDASSAFTELSMRDLNLLGLRRRDISPKGSIFECNESNNFSDVADNSSLHLPDTWIPRHGLFTLGDWFNNFGQGWPGHSLCKVLSSYNHIQHIVYSLLSGRPVLVVGTAKSEQTVVQAVTALSVFVPTMKRPVSILRWTTETLKISNLTTIRLAGVCRPEKKCLDSCISLSVKRACSILDVDKKVIIAPQYQGQLINTLLAKRKVLKGDVQFLSYIQWWLMDVMSKAFIFFHSFCLGSAGSILYSNSLRDQRDNYCGTVAGIMARLGLRDSDCNVVEHFAELVKMSRLQPKIWQGTNPNCIVSPIQIQHKACQVFR